MPATVKDACEPHAHVLSADPAPEIDDLVDALSEAARTPTSAAVFFDTNHVTGGMKLLFELGFRRLAGKNDQATFALAQSMGGGKTHLMIALALLARDAELRTRTLATAGVRDELTGGVQVVAVTGRRNSPHYI